MSSRLEGTVRVITGTGESMGRASAAIAVSAGIAVSAIKLVGRTTAPASGGPTSARRRPDSPDGKPSHHLIDKPKERRAA
jgi:hypothetical protein